MGQNHKGRTLNYSGFNGPPCPLGTPEGLIEGPVLEHFSHHLRLMKVRTELEPLASFGSIRDLPLPLHLPPQNFSSSSPLGKTVRYMPPSPPLPSLLLCFLFFRGVLREERTLKVKLLQRTTRSEDITDQNTGFIVSAVRRWKVGVEK